MKASTGSTGARTGQQVLFFPPSKLHVISLPWKDRSLIGLNWIYAVLHFARTTSPLQRRHSTWLTWHSTADLSLPTTTLHCWAELFWSDHVGKDRTESRSIAQISYPTSQLPHSICHSCRCEVVHIAYLIAVLWCGTVRHSTLWWFCRNIMYSRRGDEMRSEYSDAMG